MAKFYKSPETFYVQEVPKLEPSETGEHLFIKFKRKGIATTTILKKLKNILKIKESEIGCAGNKDKLSTAIQVFSLPKRLESKMIRAFDELSLEILDIKENSEKLRMGQIKGNNFSIIIQLEREEEEKEIEKKLKEIIENGFPNFFGPQRVNNDLSFEKGRAIFLKNCKKGKKRDRFFVSVFQSRIFNFYLQKRIENSLYEKPMNGDLLFSFDDFSYFPFKGESQLRNSFPTGPIVGSKMKIPSGDSYSFESKILQNFSLDFEMLKFNKVPGTRRVITLRPENVELKKMGKGKIVISFFLYKGGYASTLLETLGIETILNI